MMGFTFIPSKVKCGKSKLKLKTHTQTAHLSLSIVFGPTCTVEFFYCGWSVTPVQTSLFHFPNMYYYAGAPFFYSPGREGGTRWTERLAQGLDTMRCRWCLNLQPHHTFFPIFVLPELSSVRDYVITHSVCSMCVYVCMCMYVVFCKIDHCIHIH